MMFFMLCLEEVGLFREVSGFGLGLILGLSIPRFKTGLDLINEVLASVDIVEMLKVCTELDMKS